MSVLVNLWSQVRKTLNLSNGGTGNTEGWATAVIKVCTNRTGSTIALNTLVKLAGSYNDARVTPTTASTDKVLGVVVGYWDPDQPDVLIQAAAPDLSLVAVMTHGTARATLNSGGATRGQYAFPSSTSGAASSSATIATGAFGVFQGSGGASGTALVTLTGTQGVGMSAGATFGTPALTLGTANAAGAASTAIRTDATILAFDATTPASSPLGGSGSVGAATVAARRDHVHPVTGALDALSDVTAPTPSSGDVLAWNGSAWVNQSLGAVTSIWRPLMGSVGPADGTWTPALHFDTDGTMTYVTTEAKGIYQRYGNRVAVDFYLNGTLTLGTASGNFYVSGLPFTVLTLSDYFPANTIQVIPYTNASLADLVGVPLSGDTKLFAYWSGSATNGQFGVSDLVDGALSIWGHADYAIDGGAYSDGVGGNEVIVDGDGQAVMAYGPA